MHRNSRRILIALVLGLHPWGISVCQPAKTITASYGDHAVDGTPKALTVRRWPAVPPRGQSGRVLPA
jgi:hypothetical protein